MFSSGPHQSTQSLLPELPEDLARLAARLETTVVDVREPLQESLGALLGPGTNALTPDFLELCTQALQRITFDGTAIAVPTRDQHSIVFCGVSCDIYRTKFAARLPMPPRPARLLMQSACESLRLLRQRETMQLQLDSSALQIAQSFEEQCWLRNLARNLSISSVTSNANMLARGILGPLLDLLRAEDLYIVVDQEEERRSGLSSFSFGGARVSTADIIGLMQQLVAERPVGPIVMNNTQLLQGRVRSLIAVPIVFGERTLGFVVAINRLIPKGQKASVLYDPEFGSVEVGLMEEASVLLSTQTHNIRLVIESQHLAIGTLQAMSRAIDARDPYTSGHSERVARLSFELAEILGLQEVACQEIYVAGVLHDIGKIGIPDRVLLKAGVLTPEEFDIIKQHPEIGYRIAEQLGNLQFTLPGILYHHERWDGAGYPHGLSGDNIPLMARIIAVADSFDAMTSSRPYRKTMELATALDIMQNGAGKQWDSMIVRGFENWREKRIRQLPSLPPAGTSIIPQEPPYANITQNVLALQI